MNPRPAFTAALRQGLEPLRLRWQALAPRERAGLAAAGAALLVYLVWAAGVQPALRTLRAAPEQRARLDADLARMQHLAAEAAELRALPPVSAAQADAALQSATGRLGESARLQRAGDRITVQFTSVESGLLLGWLNEVRSAARARVVEAQLGRIGRGYSGTVVLAIDAGR